MSERSSRTPRKDIGDVCSPLSPPKHYGDEEFESVGSHQVRGEFIIFINGINNDQKSALESAKELSSVLNNRKVLLFHNPTNLQQFMDYVDNFEGETNLSLLLSEKILRLIKRSKVQGVKLENISVIVFAHSHGTIVLQRALISLNKFDQTAKQHVEVYAFGGVTLISHKLANKVQNYFLKADIVSLFGQTKRGNSDQISLIKEIQKDKSNIEYLRLLNLLHPEFEKDCDSVIILKGPSFSCPKGEPVLNSDDPVAALAQNIRQYIRAIISFGLESHRFSTYLRLVGHNLKLRSV